MSYIIILILLLLWVTGLAAGVPMGGLYLFLPVVAVLVLLLRVVQMKRPLIAIDEPVHRGFAERLFIPQMLYFILLTVGIVLALFGLNSMLHISADMEDPSNSKRTLTAVWMLAGGVVGTSIGTVGLFRHAGKKLVRQTSSHS